MASMNPARPPALLQVVIVIALSTAFVLTTDAYGFRTLANVLWMIVLPAFLGILLNDGLAMRAFMAAALPIVSLITTMIVGANFTSYY